MFPFEQRGMISFQVSNHESSSNPTYTSQQPHINLQKVEQDLSPPLQYHHEHLANSNPNFVIRDYNQSIRKGRPRSSLLASKEDEYTTQDNSHAKKKIHREIERQRRLEMANLYSSLRDLLPIDYIKGKRSICDHITEATKYIKNLEENVKELEENRDKLKLDELPSPNYFEGSNIGSSSTNTSKSNCSLNIHSFTSSIEIEIGVPIVEDDDVFPLSRVIAVLVDEGLGIISCVSSRVNQRRIYAIDCEINDGTSIDSNQLQWRLTSVIHSHDS